MDIATASSLPSEQIQLFLNQVLLIPITCESNGTRYFSNVTYTLKKDDTFYSVSTKPFQNLTNFLLVEDMNPDMNPNNLTVGTEAVFPLLCKCPSRSFTAKGIEYFITYVWQPGDDIFPVSTTFQASEADILMENNFRHFTSAVCLPILIPVKKPIIFQHLPSPPANTKRSTKCRFVPRIVIVILSVVLVFLIVFSIFAVYFHFLYKKRKMVAHNISSLENSGFRPTYKASKNKSFEPNKLLPGVSGYLGKPIEYDLHVIMKATNNLSGRYKISGSVYKAMIDNQVFAVKRRRDPNGELQILQRVFHANLVKLMGISSDSYGNFFIVSEYIENGSLDNWLFPKDSYKVKSLSWSQRLSIALDVSNGIHYLHEHIQPPIVHKDIRTTNILIDSNYKAKISNFSSARPATSSIMLNTDVFSFGVVLLELLSGKKVMERKENGEVVMLWKEIKGILGNEDEKIERLKMWMDPNLGKCYPIDDALSLAMLGRACTCDMASERPRMAEIVFSLISVLTASSPQMLYEKSRVSEFEADEVLPVISPVVAR